MVSLAQTGLRVWTFIWTVLALSLVSNVIADAFAGNPSSVNYAEFTAVFCFLVVLIGIVAIFIEALGGIILAVVDVLAALFSFVAGVVLAAKLHVHSCGNYDYTSHNSLTNGSVDPKKRCKELQASTAFFWFMFAGFLGSAIVGFLSGGSSPSFRRGGVRKGGPSMSQV